MMPAAVPVTLTAAERKTLKKRVRGAKTPYRDWLRAQIVLAAARGRGNERIAADLGGSGNTGRQWRGGARGAEAGRAGGPVPVRASAGDQRGGPGGGGGAGLPAARSDRGAAVPLDRPGAGRRAAGAGPVQRADVGVVAAADPGGEPGEAVAVPVLDLPPRPGLRGEGERGPGPLPGLLPG